MIDVGTADEALGHQAFGAGQIGLRQPGFGFGLAHAGGKLGDFLSLHLAIDLGQHLAGANALAGFHHHAHHATTFALHTHGGIALGGNAARRGDRISQHGGAGHQHGDFRQVAGRRGGRGCGGAERLPRSRPGQRDRQRDQARLQPAVAL